MCLVFGSWYEKKERATSRFDRLYIFPVAIRRKEQESTGDYLLMHSLYACIGRGVAPLHIVGSERRAGRYAYGHVTEDVEPGPDKSTSSSINRSRLAISLHITRPPLYLVTTSFQILKTHGQIGHS